MEKQSDRKSKLRFEIGKLKKQYSAEELESKSDEVFSVLEITGQFRDASHILVYNAMADEVATLQFIDRWKAEKTFYLPVVSGDEIRFCILDERTQFVKSKIGVDEPMSNHFCTDYWKIDMAIIPGVAFDRKGNRLGRGKGYYDRFLSAHKNLFKVGVCFDFQLLDSIPADGRDVKMDMLVSENDLIW